MALDGLRRMDVMGLDSESRGNAAEHQRGAEEAADARAMPDYPLLCEPLLVPKIWGGRRLETVLGKSLPPQRQIGESWEVADLPEGTSCIANGSLAGVSLRVAMERHGKDISPLLVRGRFPLLVKFIDARQNLSVQVHPDEQCCRTLYPNACSKDECWIVMHAHPGAWVYHGLQPGTTKATLEAALSDGTILDNLRRLPVQVGDVVRVPAGTLHSLPEGVMVLEFQQPSDTTFRLYDFEQNGYPDRHRPLHVAEALDVLHVQDRCPPRPEPAVQKCPWGIHETFTDAAPFVLERLNLDAPVALSWAERLPTVVVVLQGQVLVDKPSCQVKLRAGQTCILPACLSNPELHPVGQAQVALASPMPYTQPGAQPPRRREMSSV